MGGRKAPPAPPPPSQRSTSAAQPCASAPPPAPQLRCADPSSSCGSGPAPPPPPPAPSCCSPAHSLTHCAVRNARRLLAGETSSSEVPCAPLRGRSTGPGDYIGRRLQSRRDTSDRGAPPRAAPGSRPHTGQGARGVQPNSKKQGGAPRAGKRNGARSDAPEADATNTAPSLPGKKQEAGRDNTKEVNCCPNRPQRAVTPLGTHPLPPKVWSAGLHSLTHLGLCSLCPSLL